MNTSQAYSWSAVFLAHTEKSWDNLYRFAFSLVQNAPEAEDLVQQTLVKALSGLPAFFSTNYQIENPQVALELLQKADAASIEKHLLNWMIKITKNTFLDERQKSSRRLSHVALEDWDERESIANSEDHSFHNHGSGDAPQSLAERESAFFKEALDDSWVERFETLNPRQRSILYLAAEDYSYKEIAQILDIPIGTVMSTLSRTVAKLKK